MSRLSSAQRSNLDSDDFAIPEKAPGPCSLPIPDRAHVTAALRLCAKCPGNACARVRAAVKRKFG